MASLPLPCVLMVLLGVCFQHVSPQNHQNTEVEITISTEAPAAPAVTDADLLAHFNPFAMFMSINMISSLTGQTITRGTSTSTSSNVQIEMPFNRHLNLKEEAALITLVFDYLVSLNWEMDIGGTTYKITNTFQYLTKRPGTNNDITVSISTKCSFYVNQNLCATGYDCKVLSGKPVCQCTDTNTCGTMTQIDASGENAITRLGTCPTVSAITSRNGEGSLMTSA